MKFYEKIGDLTGTHYILSTTDKQYMTIIAISPEHEGITMFSLGQVCLYDEKMHLINESEPLVPTSACSEPACHCPIQNMPQHELNCAWKEWKNNRT